MEKKLDVVNTEGDYFLEFRDNKRELIQLEFEFVNGGKQLVFDFNEKEWKEEA